MWQFPQNTDNFKPLVHQFPILQRCCHRMGAVGFCSFWVQKSLKAASDFFFFPRTDVSYWQLNYIPWWNSSGKKKKKEVQALVWASAIKTRHQSKHSARIMAVGRERKVTSAPNLSWHCYKLSFRCRVFLSSQLAAANVITSPHPRQPASECQRAELSSQFTFQTLCIIFPG